MQAPGASTDPSDDLLKPEAVAKMLGISTKALARLPIKRLRLGPRMVRYRREWVSAYIDAEAA
jgi:predicted DNA-binding transcriptional regulator AlpA